MAVKLSCRCGEKLTVPDGAEGKLTLCPSCGAEVRVPGGEGGPGREGDEGPPPRLSSSAADSGASAARAGEQETGEPGSPSAVFRDAIDALGHVFEARTPSAKRGEASDRSKTAETLLIPLEGAGADEKRAKTRRKGARAGEPGGRSPESPGAPAGKPKKKKARKKKPKERERRREERGKALTEPPRAVAGAAAAPRRPPERPRRPEAPEAQREEEEGRGRAKVSQEAEGERKAAPSPPPAAIGEKSKGEQESMHQESPPERSGTSSSKAALSPEEALAEVEERAFKKALLREGEPETDLSPHEPEKVEVFGNVMKFHCKCGKRISAPASQKKSVGRCPRCGGRILIPKAPGTGPPQAPERRAPGVKQAVLEAADRMGRASRRRRPGRRAAAPLSRRLAASAIDAALCGIGFAGPALGAGGGKGFIIGGVLAGVVWVAGKAIVPVLSEGTPGMHFTGLLFADENGGRASALAKVVRALAGVMLFPLSPLTLLSGDGRSPADKVAGTMVMEGWNRRR